MKTALASVLAAGVASACCIDARQPRYAGLTACTIELDLDSRTVEVDGKRLHGRNVLIATGSRPVFPAMAEALKIVATSRFKDPAKLSCCAE